MKEAAIYFLETLACSGVLLAAYVLLLERRTHFFVCRLYLLVSTALAAVIPLLRIPVWAPAATPAVRITVGDAALAAEVLPDGAPFDWMPCVGGVYLFGVLFLTAVLVVQTLRIRSLRRGGTAVRTNGISVVRTARPVASFSFFGTVYIDRDVPEEDLPAILLHEASHIRHRHSLERMILEGMKVLLWWNPFVWIAAGRLAEVQEYEADSDVIRAGYDAPTYIRTIFRQLFGYRPDIANGLRDSLTKKRFQMMTTPQKSRHALLRIAGLAPVVLGLLAAFGFTARAESTVQTPPPADSAEAISTASQDEENEPFLMVEKMPVFQDGNIRKFREWVIRQVRYPDAAVASGSGGRVVAQFVVRADGSVGDVTILQSPGEEFSAEVRRVLESSPRWTPGMQKGRAVRVKYTLPVDFDIQNGARPNTVVAMTSVDLRDGEEPASDQAALLAADEMPLFEGEDIAAFRRWVMQRVRYPAEAQAEGINGKVVATFVVEADGSVTPESVLMSPASSLAEEVLRVLRLSPRWTPGRKDGKAVRVKYTLPIEFRMEIDDPDAKAVDEVVVVGYGKR